MKHDSRSLALLLRFNKVKLSELIQYLFEHYAQKNDDFWTYLCSFVRLLPAFLGIGPLVFCIVMQNDRTQKVTEPDFRNGYFLDFV